MTSIPWFFSWLLSVVPPLPTGWQELGPALQAIAAVLTFLALCVAAVFALRRHRRSVKVESAELLLKMEEEFRANARTLIDLDDEDIGAGLEDVMQRFSDRGDLSAEDLQCIEKIDRALRFFYLCTVLHTDLKIERGVVARSYYYYFNLLDDHARRPELVRYVRKFFPRLSMWIRRHRYCRSLYGSTGIWWECVAVPRFWVRREIRREHQGEQKATASASPPPEEEVATAAGPAPSPGEPAR